MTKNITVLGANGFVGSSICEKLKLKGFSVTQVKRHEIDFLEPSCSEKLRDFCGNESMVVLAFAKAPAKCEEDLFANLSMVRNVSNGLKKIAPEYILNISSDAVFEDTPGQIFEDSLRAPLNFHGIMHLARESILNQFFANRIGHLRPTLIFGDGDPHNAYGPNSFLRKARDKQDIKLFGMGEEQRDHIHIDDVVEIVIQMLVTKYLGGLNAVSGTITTFNEIASKALSLFNPRGKLIYTERMGPMPHNGYRAFDNSRLVAFMPELRCLNVIDYLQREFDASV